MNKNIHTRSQLKDNGHLPSSSSGFSKKVSSIMSGLAHDIVQMCDLDINKTQKRHSSKNCSEQQGDNPLLKSLSSHPELLNEFGLNDEDVRKSSKQIWNLMTPKYQCYLRQTCKKTASQRSYKLKMQQ